MSGLKTAVPFFAFAILLVLPAKAATSYYLGGSGETAFNTGVGGLTLLDPALTFSGSPDPDGLHNASGTGIDFLGFDTAYIFNSPLGFVINAGQLTGSQAEVVKITFPAAGVYAFGFHITVASGNGNWCIDVTQSGCGYNAFNSSPSDVQFFGFVSDAPVSAPLYVHYATGSPSIVFTNFEAYSAAEAPEPGAMLLVSLGLVIFRLGRRKARPA
jgi:hypothetical protein